MFKYLVFLALALGFAAAGGALGPAILAEPGVSGFSVPGAALGFLVGAGIGGYAFNTLRYGDRKLRRRKVRVPNNQ